ncbi:myb-related transcription factor, partner of profilin-like [Pleurodeles waltl]|uniref:myb-related transcription factor, partner of profilin-like n=1 Tax=Pleurodeles waltl TaxID=8319 RepID=UPI00370992B8
MEATTAGRKKKLKFSDKELEVLTEECRLHHEVMFGKAAISVPDTQKKKIWLDIQSKINAIGVIHRTIEDVRKRWYDLSPRTKESVAEWLREVHGTGGGPSTVPPPTATESMVDTTLEPEVVIGIGDLNSSAPGTSKSLPQVSTDDPSVEGDDDATMTADEAVSISAGKCSTAPIVHHARETTEETDVDNEAGNLPSGPQMASVSAEHVFRPSVVIVTVRRTSYSPQNVERFTMNKMTQHLLAHNYTVPETAQEEKEDDWSESSLLADKLLGEPPSFEDEPYFPD